MYEWPKDWILIQIYFQMTTVAMDFNNKENYFAPKKCATQVQQVSKVETLHAQ